MVKNLRKSKDSAETAANSAPAQPAISSKEATAQPEKKAAKKKSAAKATGRAKPAPKPRGTTPRKVSATRQSRPAAASKSDSNKRTISDDEIRMRAYFIGEDRMRQGVVGDPAHDWLEARRQLQSEAGRPA